MLPSFPVIFDIAEHFLFWGFRLSILRTSAVMTCVSTFVHRHSQTLSEKPDSGINGRICSRCMIIWPLSHTFKLSWSKRWLQMGFSGLSYWHIAIYLSSYNVLSLHRISLRSTAEIICQDISYIGQRTGCRFIHAVLHGPSYLSFKFRANLRLISSAGLLLSSCIILYHMVDAQLLFKPGFIPRREHGERCILQQNVGVHTVWISQKKRDYSPKSH